MIYTREGSLIASSPRHDMELHVRLGASKDGTIRAIDVYTLSNTGAYGEHGPTTVGLSGHKSIPLYTNNLEPSALPMTWCTPTASPPEPTAVTAPPRASSPWSRQ